MARTHLSRSRTRDPYAPAATRRAQPTPAAEATATAAPSRPSFSGLSHELGASFPIQAKLTVGAADDQYEREADAVAAQVVKTINHPQAQQATQIDSALQMMPETLQRQDTEDDEIQMKPMLPQVGIAGGEVSAEFGASLQRAKTGGYPLAPALQAQMGQAMGADFSGVRVHTDSQSDRLNQSIQAKAFTTGQDLFFRQGAYQPGNREGQELIAHELTHAVQQTGIRSHGRTIGSQSVRPNRKLMTSLANHRQKGITIQRVKWKDFETKYRPNKPISKRISGDAHFLAILRFIRDVPISIRAGKKVSELLKEAEKFKGLSFSAWKGRQQSSDLQEAQHLVPHSIGRKFGWSYKLINSEENAKMLLAGRKGKGDKPPGAYIKAKRNRLVSSRRGWARKFWFTVVSSYDGRSGRSRGMRHIRKGVAHPKYNEMVEKCIINRYHKWNISLPGRCTDDQAKSIMSELRKWHTKEDGKSRYLTIDDKAEKDPLT
jgi:hypothetical protein